MINQITQLKSSKYKLCIAAFFILFIFTQCATNNDIARRLAKNPEQFDQFDRQMIGRNRISNDQDDNFDQQNQGNVPYQQNQYQPRGFYQQQQYQGANARYQQPYGQQNQYQQQYQQQYQRQYQAPYQQNQYRPSYNPNQGPVANRGIYSDPGANSQAYSNPYDFDTGYGSAMPIDNDQSYKLPKEYMNRQ